ncbi:MAG: hypothetical protein KDA66_17105, partial [Planctomycetaceae bacterium]|nr:hypothetical protein [Planctomycetaceae bacterium]
SRDNKNIAVYCTVNPLAKELLESQTQSWRHPRYHGVILIVLWLRQDACGKRPAWMNRTRLEKCGFVDSTSTVISE